MENKIIKTAYVIKIQEYEYENNKFEDFVKIHNRYTKIIGENESEEQIIEYAEKNIPYKNKRAFQRIIEIESAEKIIVGHSSVGFFEDDKLINEI